MGTGQAQEVTRSGTPPAQEEGSHAVGGSARKPRLGCLKPGSGEAEGSPTPGQHQQSHSGPPPPLGLRQHRARPAAGLVRSGVGFHPDQPQGLTHRAKNTRSDRNKGSWRQD